MPTVPPGPAAGNNGENTVFPIQVSRGALFLFLGCCYCYGRLPEHVGPRGPGTPGWHAILHRHHRVPHALRLNLPTEREIEGEVTFPIQVHRVACYCYSGAVIFIRSPQLKRQNACQECDNSLKT